jgi:hypothetical protein
MNNSFVEYLENNVKFIPGESISDRTSAMGTDGSGSVSNRPTQSSCKETRIKSRSDISG